MNPNYEPDVQVVEAGQQFDGSERKGKFHPPVPVIVRHGYNICRILMDMGGESKNITISIVRADGTEYPLDTVVGTTNEKYVFLGEVPMLPRDWLKIVTTGATAAMRAEVLFSYGRPGEGGAV